MKTITYDEFIKQYKPIKNTFNQDSGHDGLMFETYGEEYEYVYNFPNYQIWTLHDDGNTIVSGIHFINHLGYFITEIPSNSYIERGEVTVIINSVGE